jgi:hypothetical protein
VSRLFLLLALSLTSLLDAQSLRVYSEFYRIDPFGKPIPADSGPEPREIISPAVARNGFTSFRIVVTAPPAIPFTLHIAQNPDNTAEIKLYREIYIKSGETWIPDRLEPVEVPYTGTVAQAVRTIPGQTVQSFWLDARLPATVPPTRFRLEAQLNINQEWIIYPMEVRVQQAVLPAPPESKTGLSPLESPSDSPALSVFREYLCGAPSGKPEPDMSVRLFIRRNALQDAALARALEPSRTRQILHQTLIWSAGFPDLTPAAWCKAPKRPDGAGSEWYLKVRQYLLSGQR